MNYLNKTGFLILLLVTTGCATTVRTHYNEPAMTVMVDPQTLSQGAYNELVVALSESGKWKVLDRSNGFNAAVAEQELQDSTRFKDREKLARWARLHGAGGVISAMEACEQRLNTLWGWQDICSQQAILINASTGEVIAAAAQKLERPSGEVSEWHEVIEKLNKKVPNTLKVKAEAPELAAYKDEIEAEHKRESK